MSQSILLRLGCLFLLLTVFLTPFCLLAYGLLWVNDMAFEKVVDPETYEKKVAGLIGGEIGTLKYISIKPEDAEKLQVLGLDPSRIPYEIAANQWINSRGANIDLSLQLSILKNESAGGTNMGNSDGLKATLKFSQGNYYAALWLLKRMKEYDVKSWSEAARTHINADYSNYIGHSVGEMGPDGALPETGKIRCLADISSHTDPHIASCNFFDREVSPYFKVSLLNYIGARHGLSDYDLHEKLFGWNQDPTYRWKLITDANTIAAVISDINLDGFERIDTVYFDSKNRTFIQKVRLWWLGLFNLIPERLYADIRIEDEEDNGGGDGGDGIAPGSLSMPIKDGNRGVTTWPSDIHPGYDFGCVSGSPILAADDGTVVIPNRYGWRYDSYGWGNSVWIDHGGGFYTHYAHLLVPSNVIGNVSRGQEIGKCGSTGNSTGPHLHFEVTKLHPDQYRTWDDPRALVLASIYLRVGNRGQ